MRAGIGFELFGEPAIDVVARVAWGILGGQVGGSTIQIVAQDWIEGENAAQRSPFGRHVGDAEALIHRETCDAVADKLDDHVQHFIVIEHAAQRDNDVLAHDPRK